MPTLLKPGLKTSLVEALYNEILTNSNNYYYYIGKALPWTVSDVNIPTPGASLREEADVRDDIIFMKKITSADVSFIVPNRPWISGTVFDMYDDLYGSQLQVDNCTGTAGTYTISGVFDLSTIEIGTAVSGTGVVPGSRIVGLTATTISIDIPLSSSVNGTIFLTWLPYSGESRLSLSNFYCITTDNHVYKCLFNNYNSPSTVKPFSTTADVLNTSDGYIWKYMYTVPVSLANRFSTPTDIPVTTSIKSQFFSRGALQSATILSYGQNYGPDTVLDIGGDGNREGNRWRILSTALVEQGYGYQSGSTTPESVTTIKAGYRYKIFEVGTTDFTLCGAESNTVGTIFYATINGSGMAGTGTIQRQDPVITWEPPYTFTDFQPQTQYLVGEYVRNPDTQTIYAVDVAGVSGDTAPYYTKTSTVYNGTAGFRFVGIDATLAPNNGVVLTDTAITQLNMKTILGYVNLTSVGYGYDPNNPPVVTVSSATGTGAEVKASVAGSTRLSGLVITARGDGYLSADTASIQPPFGTSTNFAWAQVRLQPVSLSDLLLVGGNIYEVVTAGTLSDTPPTHQSGTAANGTAVLEFVDQTTDALTWASVDGDVVIENDVITNGGLFYRVLNGGTLSPSAPTHNWGIDINGNVQLEFIGQNAAATIEFFLGFGYNFVPNVTIAPPFNIEAINTGTPGLAYPWTIGDGDVAKGDIVYNQGLYYQADPGVAWSSGATVALDDVIFYVQQNAGPGGSDLVRYYYVSDVTSGTSLGTTPPSHLGGAEQNGSVFLTYIDTATVLEFISSGTFSTVLPPTSRTDWSINGTVALKLLGIQALGQVAVLKTQAKYVPVLQNGQIVSVVAIDPGVGYTVADIEAQSESGSGAQIEFNLTTGDVDTQQSNVELLAIPGSIDVIKVIQPGNNYVWAKIEIVGDGEGCTAVAVIEDGAITRIQVLTPGSGYSRANVYITGNAEANPAYARAIISPLDGHGSNAIRELFATDISIATTIAQEPNQGFKVDNDYRQLGLLKNPLEYGTNLRYTASTGSTCFSVTGKFFFNDLDYDDILTDSYGRQYRLIAKPDEAPVLDQSQFSILIQNVRIGTAPKTTKVNITSASWSSDTVTFTTENPHELTRGSPFIATGVKSSDNLNAAFGMGYNRKYIVISTPSNTTVLAQLKVEGGETPPGTYSLGANSSYTGQLNNLSSLKYSEPLQVGDVLYYGTNRETAISSLTTPTVNKYSGDILFIDNRPSFKPSQDQSLSFKTAIRL